MDCRGKARPLSALGLVTLLQHIPQTGGAKVHKTMPLRLFSGTRPRASRLPEGDSARILTPAALLSIVMLTLSPTLALAIELKAVANQIILTGPVLGDEPGKLRGALASSGEIDTVILRNSSGGNAPGVAERPRNSSAGRRDGVEAGCHKDPCAHGVPGVRQE